MAIVAGRTYVLVIVNTGMLVVHFGLTMFVAGSAVKDGKIIGGGVALIAIIPFSLMRA
jgi:hypothetical protein